MFTEVVDSLVGLSDEELTARIEANELERRRLDAEMSAALAIADARNLAAADGHRSMAAFCRARLNWSTAEATRRLGLARAVDNVADLGALWSDGRFGIAQATKISMAYANKRIRDDLSDIAPPLLDNAEQMPYADFVVTVDHFVSTADEDGAHDDRDEIIEGRNARLVDVGGSLDGRISGGDGLVTAEIIGIFERFCDLEFQKDVEVRRGEHGELADGFALPRTDRQRRYDAFVAMCRAASSNESAGSPAEPLVNIVIDAHTWGRMLLAAGLSTASDRQGNPIDPFTGLPVAAGVDLVDNAEALLNRRCETSNGVQLHPHDVLRAGLAGHVRRVVVDSKRVVINLGRKHRLFTGSARDAAKVLIRRCEHAGCGLPAEWCDVDHVDEWRGDTGPTDQANSAVLCAKHNNHKHEHRWRTRRGVNGCSYTIRADGTIILPVGARSPAFPEDEPDDADIDSPEQMARLTAMAQTRIQAVRQPA